MFFYQAYNDVYDVGNACVSDTDSDSVLDYQVFIVHCNFDTFDYYYLHDHYCLIITDTCVSTDTICNCQKQIDYFGVVSNEIVFIIHCMHYLPSHWLRAYS